MLLSNQSPRIKSSKFGHFFLNSFLQSCTSSNLSWDSGCCFRLLLSLFIQPAARFSELRQLQDTSQTWHQCLFVPQSCSSLPRSVDCFPSVMLFVPRLAINNCTATPVITSLSCSPELPDTPCVRVSEPDDLTSEDKESKKTGIWSHPVIAATWWRQSIHVWEFRRGGHANRRPKTDTRLQLARVWHENQRWRLVTGPVWRWKEI